MSTAANKLGEKVDLFGVGVTVTTYQHSVEQIMEAARTRTSFGVSALAVHGLMEAVVDPEFESLVRTIDLVTPDGQPVRWAMNSLHGTRLDDRVYGPDLTWLVIEAAAAQGVGIYLFGSTPQTCDGFVAEIIRRYPAALISGVQPDRFREPTAQEDADDIAQINESGAGIVLVGRGCPRQERWVAEHKGSVNAAMLAVGAAFDYGAGTLAIPPKWMQRVGLQWLFRLAKEPRRLFGRYLTTNSRFIYEYAKARLFPKNRP